MDFRLTATKREQHGKRVRALRARGQLPAVVYGHRTEATPLLLDMHEFERVYARAGRTHLIDLTLDGGGAQKVLVREIQRHPRRQGPLHVDFYRVDMREKLTADVPVVVLGESPAVKRGEADVVQMLNHLKVECLPGDIPENVHVEVSGLENVGDVIRVKELQVPDTLTVLTDSEEVVVKAQVRRELVVEEEIPAEEAAAAEVAEGAPEAAAAGEEEAEGTPQEG